jgi:hypothetical protein
LRPQKKSRFCGIHALPQGLGVTFAKGSFKLALPVWVFSGVGC